MLNHVRFHFLRFIDVLGIFAVEMAAEVALILNIVHLEL